MWGQRPSTHMALTRPAGLVAGDSPVPLVRCRVDRSRMSVEAPSAYRPSVVVSGRGIESARDQAANIAAVRRWPGAVAAKRRQSHAAAN